MSGLLLGAMLVGGAESEPAGAPPKFLGSQSCSTSGCHGGAGEMSRQFTVWSQYDFHHHRPTATLTTARSERLAEVLKLGNATQSPRCTVCHAPFQTVPAERLGKEVKISEGVSCESCHAPAENWLRAHTRKDYTHEDRVHAGMRDLKNLYVRANTCVACHQMVPSDLLNAGHPELIFELDGQAVTQPKHWRKELDKPGAQLWLVGQAVALRELSWQLATEKSPHANLTDRWAGLAWVVHKASGAGVGWPSLSPETLAPDAANFERVQKWSDELARAVAGLQWDGELTRKSLAALVNSADAFAGDKATGQGQARRAERLVLALDRLTLALPGAKSEAVNAALNRLFTDVQSVPDFEPNQFVKDLKEFQASVSGVLASQ